MNGLQRWLGGRFLIRDVRKTIGALQELAGPYRASIARKLAEEIDRMVGLLLASRERGLEAEQECWRELMLDAVAARHVSLSIGAQSRTNPQWAKAALSESWLTGASGRFGAQGTAAQKLIDDFVRTNAAPE